ncbi:DUF917 family protein [Microbacterium sp. NPDC055910]|uniref:S-methyl thiohydantoin desulfurase domain-containing protein n=1 Tax=Microbacterium sp. NPDC055910 TaxID=3345659 RepID=UPI0035DF49DD
MTSDAFGPADAADLAAGAQLLASGGGGEVATAELLLTSTLAAAAHDGRGLTVVAAKDLAPDDLIVHVGIAGSPDVFAERLIDPRDVAAAVRMMERRLQRRVAAIGVIEIGGLNALLAPISAITMDLPLIDGDIMGRAFPFIEQTTLARAGHRPDPLVLTSPSGDVAVYEGRTPAARQRLLLSGIAAMGGLAAVAMYPVTASQLSADGISGSVTAARSYGRRYREHIATDRSGDLDAIALAIGAHPIGRARIDEVIARNGPDIGSASLHDVTDGSILRLDYLEEYVLVSSDGVAVAAAPNVIIAIDHTTFRPLLSHELRTGNTVLLMSLPALHEWGDTTADLVGPGAYGIHFEETRR